MKTFILLVITGMAMVSDAYAVEYLGQKHRDPFGLVNQPQPKQQTVIKREALVLQGVVWNAKQPQAIINGKVVKAGDVLNDIKVLEIKKEGVRAKYTDQEQEFVLQLNSERTS